MLLAISLPPLSSNSVNSWIHDCRSYSSRVIRIFSTSSFSLATQKVRLERSSRSKSPMIFYMVARRLSNSSLTRGHSFISSKSCLIRSVFYITLLTSSSKAMTLTRTFYAYRLSGYSRRQGVLSPSRSCFCAEFLLAANSMSNSEVTLDRVTRKVRSDC